MARKSPRKSSIIFPAISHCHDYQRAYHIIYHLLSGNTMPLSLQSDIVKMELLRKMLRNSMVEPSYCNSKTTLAPPQQNTKYTIVYTNTGRVILTSPPRHRPCHPPPRPQLAISHGSLRPTHTSFATATTRRTCRPSVQRQVRDTLEKLG